MTVLAVILVHIVSINKMGSLLLGSNSLQSYIPNSEGLCMDGVNSLCATEV